MRNAMNTGWNIEFLAIIQYLAVFSCYLAWQVVKEDKAKKISSRKQILIQS